MFTFAKKYPAMETIVAIDLGKNKRVYFANLIVRL